MSRSCHSATFSSPTVAAARTTRASPQIRSATTGFRLCGIADEPFCPRRTAPRPRDLRAGEVRISSANVSSDGAQRARARQSSAWRSRWRICVETAPARARAARTRRARPRVGCRVRADGARELSDPHALERSREPRAVAVELERPAASLSPNVVGSAWIAVRAADLQRLPVLLRRATTAAKRALEPCDAARRRRGSAARAPCRRRRTRSARSGTSALGAELFGDRVDEGGDIVVRLGPRSPPHVSGTASRLWRLSRQRTRTVRRRPPPSLRARRARHRASARACPRPTKSWPWPGGSSGRSLTAV
jgi:hypothetical protein